MLSESGIGKPMGAMRRIRNHVGSYASQHDGCLRVGIQPRGIPSGASLVRIWADAQVLTWPAPTMYHSVVYCDCGCHARC
jgi:hypothetical protein